MSATGGVCLGGCLLGGVFPGECLPGACLPGGGDVCPEGCLSRGVSGQEVSA